MNIMGLFSKKNVASKNIAKERLQFVLIHDKTAISPQIAKMIRKDVIKSISKYIEIDESKLEIELTCLKDEGKTKAAIIANIPIVGVKAGN